MGGEQQHALAVVVVVVVVVVVPVVDYGVLQHPSSNPSSNALTCVPAPLPPACLPALPADLGAAVGFGYFPPPPSPPPPSPRPPPPSPPPPSPPPPLVPFQPGNSSEDPAITTQSVDDNASLQYGQWGLCSAPCGPGWQTRTASCLAEGGALLTLGQCPEGAAAVTSRACR